VSIIPLQEIGAADAGRVGGKAANLGELRRAGLRVPDGFVVVGALGQDLVRQVAALGDVPLAVRSSALAEDLTDASFAGQYETILNVRGMNQVRAAIRRCRRSASSARVATYRAHQAERASEEMAVLIQRMVPAGAAGVAFTANPVTGDRSEVVISAVRGLGESLVSGQATAEEWVVRDGRASLRRAVDEVIGADDATAIAELARRAAEVLGRPQDVEWALAGGDLYLLQSRPMTALPAPVAWEAPEVRGFHLPGPSYWMRNLRLGEWLPEPVTPLFEDWLLKAINRGFACGARRDTGISAGLRNAIVNGWYYTTPEPGLTVGELLRAIFTRPLPMFRFATAIIKQPSDPWFAERRFFGRVVRRWREETLRNYRELVAEAAGHVVSAPVSGIPAIIDRVGDGAGEAFWALTIGGGSAWKIEVALSRFYREHLSAQVPIDTQVLLAGLATAEPGAAPHAVTSADWYWPTLAEMDLPPSPGLAERRLQLADRRLAAEEACRRALEGKPELRRRFDALLELAQRYARLREEQAGSVTLAWPLLRTCVLRLADRAVERQVITDRDDAFFLTRDELEAAATGEGEDLVDQVRKRRSAWERSRRLMAPLALGTMPKVLERVVSALEVVRSERPTPEGALRGEPASPGRASGTVRLVRGSEDFVRFRPGEVLVAQTTAPAWTPLFAQAAAVVTDGGSLAAHASLVAREYGIPAVVATGDATARLVDGEWVTVDGSAGLVEVQR
jgi:pyruvate,water dikinase